MKVLRTRLPVARDDGPRGRRLPEREREDRLPPRAASGAAGLQGGGGERARAWVQGLEQACLQHPYQWFNFYETWEQA